MKKLLLSIVIIISTQNLTAQTFAKSMGSALAEAGLSVAVDASGNVYSAGYFNGTVDFDPGAGITNLVSAGAEDIFIVKLDAAGNFLWAKSMGGAGNEYAQSVAADAAGNIYTTGYFNGTADFDPGAGIINYTSAGNTDIFISKLDADGNFIWAKSMGGTGVELSQSLAVDASGNIYTTGYFESTVDFDPGAGIANLVSAGGSDIFISKLDGAGNYVWAKRTGGTGIDVGNLITVDAGNVYTTGYFYSTVDFNPGAGVSNLVSAGGSDIFICKLDAAGNFVWAKNMGGSINDISYSIAVDGSGNVYSTGYFQATADFDPGAATATLTSAGSFDIFISKLDVAGNYVWAKNMSGASTEAGNSIAVDVSGNVYATGYFQATADFDPGAGTANLTSAGNTDIFILKIDAAGNYVWAKNIGGSAADIANAIALDGVGNVYTTGHFQASADFDPGAGTITLTSLGGNDIFVCKLDLVSLLPLRLINFNAAAAGKSNVLRWQTANEINSTDFIIQRSNDGINFTAIGSLPSRGAAHASYNYEDAFIKAPVYYYRLKMLDNDGKFTYSNIIKLTNQPLNQLTIYPNPVKDRTSLQVNDKNLIGTTIKLLDANGRTVKKIIVNTLFETVDMSQLPAGMYLLQTINKATQKLIKE